MCPFNVQLEAVKLTRKNAEVKPFETGGEGQLEHLARRADAALFAMGSSTKKRPHNLTLGAPPRRPSSTAVLVLLVQALPRALLPSLLHRWTPGADAVSAN